MTITAKYLRFQFPRELDGVRTYRLHTNEYLYKGGISNSLGIRWCSDNIQAVIFRTSYNISPLGIRWCSTRAGSEITIYDVITSIPWELDGVWTTELLQTLMTVILFNSLWELDGVRTKMRKYKGYEIWSASIFFCGN